METVAHSGTQPPVAMETVAHSGTQPPVAMETVAHSKHNLPPPALISQKSADEFSCYRIVIGGPARIYL